MESLIREKSIGEIRLLEFYKNDGIKKKPTLIMYHGYTGNCEQMLLLAFRYVKEGYFTILPEAFNHGKRKTEGTIIDFYESVPKSANEINLIIEKYSDDDRIDKNRIALVGYSMGACINFSYLASREKTIKAAVCVIGSPDWVSMLDRPDTLNLLKNTGVIKTDDDLPRIIRIAEQINPINSYMNIVPTPLLIQNGEKDQLIPVEGVQKLYDLLRPCYINEDDLKLIVFPDSPHFIDPGMEENTSSWLTEHL